MSELHARLAVPAALCLGVVLTAEILVTGSVLYTTAVLALGCVAAACLLRPDGATGIIAFGVIAFPKSGAKIGGLPLPVMLAALLGIVVVWLVVAEGPSDHDAMQVWLVVACAGWLVLRLAILVLHDAHVPALATVLGWWVPTVALLFALGSLRGLSRRVGVALRCGVVAGLLAAAGFAVVQWIAGVEATAVPGLTIAAGDTYADKPIYFPGGVKYPSTYHNGNLFGVVSATGVLWAVTMLLRRRQGHQALPAPVLVLTAAACGYATLLSGSRTALLGLVLGAGALAVASRRPAVWGSAAVGLVVGVLVISQVPALSARFSSGRLLDRTGSGRSGAWSRFLADLGPLDAIGGTWDWALRHQSAYVAQQYHVENAAGFIEGWAGILEQVGLVGVVLLGVLAWRAVRPLQIPYWLVLLVPLMFSMLIDAAYIAFPTIPAVLLVVASLFQPADGAAEHGARDSDGTREEELQCATVS